MTATPQWFHVHFDLDGTATVRIPGPLTRHRVQAGDVIYRINSRIPTRQSVSRYTSASNRALRQYGPARYAEARWDAQGRLWLTLGR